MADQKVFKTSTVTYSSTGSRSSCTPMGATSAHPTAPDVADVAGEACGGSLVEHLLTVVVCPGEPPELRPCLPGAGIRPGRLTLRA